jgi:hypothetical protein
MVKHVFEEACHFSDSLKVEFPFIQVGNLDSTTVLKCTVSSLNFPIASGGRASITGHLQAKMHKNALLAKFQSGCVTDYFRKRELSKPEYDLAVYDGI